MWKDPIVEEVRAVRDEYAKKFGYDIETICRDLRGREAASGHPVVSLPPKWMTSGDDESGTDGRAA